MLELSFEKEVVKTLTTGNNQWVERKDLYGATPDQLWANFRDKLNNNNYAKLQGRPLTDTEFNQVKRAVEVRTPYEAAKLLAAENGIGKVEVERDDAKLGTVTLELFWKADVAGGKSSYEVVRQAVRPRLAGTQDVDPDRRSGRFRARVQGRPVFLSGHAVGLRPRCLAMDRSTDFRV